MEEQVKEKLNEEQIKDIKKKMTDVLELSETEELLKSNEKIFEHEGVTYRVRKPTFKEKQEVYQKRVEKFTELLKNDKYSLERDLIKTYLKRDIDIEAMSQEMFNKAKRRDDLMVQLGELIKNGSPDNELEQYKTEIQQLNAEIQAVTIQKTSLLEFSIENQVLIYVYSYMTFLVSEKKEGDNWIKVWKTFDEFQNSTGSLVNKLSYYTTLMGGYEE